MWALTSQASFADDLGVAVLELDPCRPGGLDLGAGQDQAGLEPLQEVVVVAGAAGCRSGS